MSPIRRPRRLVVVWLLVAVLAAAIVGIEYADRRARPSGDAPETDPRRLVSAPVEELAAIEIAARGRLHRFERDAAGAWFYHGVHTEATAAHAHEPDPALAERIARAVAAFGRTRIERELPLDRPTDTYGVATPDVVVLAYRRGQTQPLGQYAVGHVAPDTVSQYVMVVGRPGVVTIPKYQIDNLLELVRVAGAEAGPHAAGAAERR